jgi:hypothetical protein
VNKREVDKETSKEMIGKSNAASSHRALSYNLISPHTIKRLAQRKSVGFVKYGSVQFRQGINDAEYVADRFNHLVNHLLEFMDHGNEGDDNIGGMLWALDCLSEVERLCPEALKHVVGISNLFGKEAVEFHQKEMRNREKK